MLTTDVRKEHGVSSSLPTQWIDLKILKESNPVQVGEHVISRGIQMNLRMLGGCHKL